MYSPLFLHLVNTWVWKVRNSQMTLFCCTSLLPSALSASLPASSAWGHLGVQLVRCRKTSRAQPRQVHQMNPACRHPGRQLETDQTNKITIQRCMPALTDRSHTLALQPPVPLLHTGILLPSEPSLIHRNPISLKLDGRWTRDQKREERAFDQKLRLCRDTQPCYGPNTFLRL